MKNRVYSFVILSLLLALTMSVAPALAGSWYPIIGGQPGVIPSAYGGFYTYAPLSLDSTTSTVGWGITDSKGKWEPIGWSKETYMGGGEVHNTLECYDLNHAPHAGLCAFIKYKFDPKGVYLNVLTTPSSVAVEQATTSLAADEDTTDADRTALLGRGLALLESSIGTDFALAADAAGLLAKQDWTDEQWAAYEALVTEYEAKLAAK